MTKTISKEKLLDFLRNQDAMAKNDFRIAENIKYDTSKGYGQCKTIPGSAEHGRLEMIDDIISEFEL